MLKKALKNYFFHALYIFVAMGIIYLFLIIVTYSFLFSTIKNLGVMFGDIFDLISESVELSGSAVEEFIDYSVAQIDWSADFFTVVKQIVDTNWLETSVKGFLNTLNVTTDNFTSEFNEILNVFVGNVISGLVVGIVFLFIGVYLANTATGYLLRRRTVKRNIKQLIINFVVSPLFLTALVFALMWLSVHLKGYTLILLVLIGLVYEIISLTQSWLVYGKSNLKFKEVVNIKNVGFNILAAVIIIAIGIALFLLLALINLFIAILIIVPVAVYSANVIGVNADSYVSELNDLKPQKKDA